MKLTKEEKKILKIQKKAAAAYAKYGDIYPQQAKGFNPYNSNNPALVRTYWDMLENGLKTDKSSGQVFYKGIAY